MVRSDRIGNVLYDVRLERERQEKLKAEGKFPFSCADHGMLDCERYAVLGEEVGEVGHELNEAIGRPDRRDRAALRAELVQVAAVCVAWCEALDRESIS